MKRSLLAAAAMLLMATTVQAEERLLHYITPSGPTKVIRYGTVACLDFKDLIDVVMNQTVPGGMGIDVDGLIKARRCFAIPVGTLVEVVQRDKGPDGKDMNSVCIRPAGMTGRSPCLSLLIQQLDVNID
jgi:hypothetical protein